MAEHTPEHKVRQRSYARGAPQPFRTPDSSSAPGYVS